MQLLLFSFSALPPPDLGLSQYSLLEPTGPLSGSSVANCSSILWINMAIMLIVHSIPTKWFSTNHYKHFDHMLWPSSEYNHLHLQMNRATYMHIPVTTVIPLLTPVYSPLQNGCPNGKWLDITANCDVYCTKLPCCCWPLCTISTCTLLFMPFAVTSCHLSFTILGNHSEIDCNDHSSWLAHTVKGTNYRKK